MSNPTPDKDALLLLSAISLAIVLSVAQPPLWLAIPGLAIIAWEVLIVVLRVCAGVGMPKKGRRNIPKTA